MDFNFYLKWKASKIFTLLKKLQYPVLAKYLDQIQIFFQIYVILLHQMIEVYCKIKEAKFFKQNENNLIFHGTISTKDLIKVSILFPETCVIAHARPGTYPKKFTCAINVINYKILLKKYVAHQFPQINHFSSLLDMDILSCMHFHKKCICLKPT